MISFVLQTAYCFLLQSDEWIAHRCGHLANILNDAGCVVQTNEVAGQSHLFQRCAFRSRLWMKWQPCCILAWTRSSLSSMTSHSGKTRCYFIKSSLACGSFLSLAAWLISPLYVTQVSSSHHFITGIIFQHLVPLVQWFGIGMIDRKHALFLCLMLTGIVAVLTIPALYQKYEECIDRYMRFAYLNLQMYEMVYERFSAKCFHRARDLVIEVLKEPWPDQYCVCLYKMVELGF